jgi:stage IV sporulation protein FB
LFPDHQHSNGFRLGSVGGTPIWVRPSFFILVGLFVFIDLDSKVKLEHALLWIPVILISVLVHELAHAGAIAAFGYGSSTIELGGWGGQTSNARSSRPWHEIVISAAGPLSSLALGGLFLLAFVSYHDQMPPGLFAFVRLMLWANFAWAIFNMLPIFPLDGGQVLFNALCHFIENHKALGATVAVSIVLALALGLGALWGRMFFVAIVSASLLFQNWQTWKALRGYREGMSRVEPSPAENERLSRPRGE